MSFIDNIVNECDIALKTLSNKKTGTDRNYPAELVEKNTESTHEFISEKVSNNVDATVKGITPSKPIPIQKSNMFINFLKAIKNIFLGNSKSKNAHQTKTKNFNPNYKGKKFNLSFFEIK